MGFEVGIAYLIAVIIFAVTPGSGVFAIMARAVTYGWPNCLLMIAGIVLSDMIYLLFACYGLAFIAEHFQAIFILIRWLGAAYLIYLGWRLWTQDTSKMHMGVSTVRGHLQGLVQGFLISASNPKVMIFYLAFVPGFMDLSRVSLSDISLLLILTAIGIASGTWLVAFAASSASQRLNSSGSRGLVNKTAGGTLMGLGVYIGIIKS